MNPSERPPPIEVRNLNKRYKDGPHANRDISLTVNWGEALGVLGPNGAGKTTLVRQITTELVPSSGEVRVRGIDAVADPDQAKARIGVVPQEARLFDGLSVHQHLRIFGVLRGLSRRDARHRTDELIEQLDLKAHRNVPSERLSGGLRRRLLVGVAMLAEPDVLILDEPTVGLDVESRQRLWDVIQSYRQRDAAVLLTTHYMEEAGNALRPHRHHPGRTPDLHRHHREPARVHRPRVQADLRDAGGSSDRLRRQPGRACRPCAGGRRRRVRGHAHEPGGRLSGAHAERPRRKQDRWRGLTRSARRDPASS